MEKQIIFTIGHSIHPIDEFIELLKVYCIKEVVDVRTIPKSRHNPQFNEDGLKQSLREAHFSYMHLKKLGGLRRAIKNSINLGWHNTSFRGYADYMATSEFNEGLEALMKIAGVKKTAIMCAEAVPWNCHRSLIADALTKKGWIVRDIMSKTSAKKHRLTPFLKVRNGQLIYPEPKI
ncbi:MAG: DUF488 domain-containing protein [bacterium]|nr:DUF488 domain-containing protein [bacterium]